MPKSVCGACGRTFSSVTAFDRHRAGTFEPLTRRCLTDEEIEARGLVHTALDIWQFAGDDRIQQLRASKRTTTRKNR
jgi:hypothetical protein